MVKGILIYPPTQLMEVDIPKPDGTLGLLYIASSLEKNNIEVDILDSNVGTSEQSLENTIFRLVPQENGLTRIGMSFEEIAKYVYKNQYDFVGLTSNYTSQMRMVIETTKAIKNINSDIKIYVGGTNAMVMYEEFLNTKYFDGVCLTEGELIFPRMLKNGIENTSGWAYLNGNDIKINPVDESCFPQNLDDLPMPAWEKLPFNKYDKLSPANGRDPLGIDIGRSVPIITSRGCRFQCAYCHISGKKKDIGKLRLHSINRVISEIKYLKSLGIKKIYFEDDTLLANKERVKTIFKLIKDEGLTILGTNGVNIIDFFNKINDKCVIDYEYLKILKDAGFSQTALALESGSQRILNKYCTGKVQLNKMDIISLMKVMNNIGIRTAVNIILGFPDESEEEMRQSIEMGKKLKIAGASYITFFICLPLPGTKLFEMAIKNGYLDNNFNTDMITWRRAIMKNTKVSPERILEIRNKANKECNNENFIHEIEDKTIKGLRNNL